ncbi:uncharacterized protein LOC124352472 isoform X1 [Daphnia pulicaria]|uniref:uncharacterized protein LOC124352472 isoform X1 n=1 Tax=Daphnia pulicaria TaxID=35523 RepID=UPI001EEBBFE9|nr:uncharacterized protein LOC124352472 isoform X1 [Daphnia pulicaria]XP_046657969.1 uncharacterized protein LOC124352472 isoform X1 [Daphnia pulicaria]XP_046657977.1 uncharacterized protein LOC124352472 isoform X1 [Daphnia pulicaria]
MESPTRLSQSRFFRFGRLSSKASRKSSSGYSNHSFTAHPLEAVDQNCPVETSYASSEIIYQQLNHRSASMSTLPSSLPPGTYTPLPYGENFGMHQPRLSQLQTLEAKMASIAVSLSGGGRRSAGTLPHHHQPSLRSSPSVDTVRSVGKASSSTGSHLHHHHQQQQQQQRSSSGSSSSKHIRNEIELLRKIIHDKDVLIQSLQQQREQQGATMTTVLQQQQQQQPTSVTSGTNWATSNERQQIERRLALIHRDIELKRAVIKNLRLSLQQTNVSDNIDSHIKQAETEYQLEREETNLLNLQDEKRTLLLRFGGAIHQWGRNGVGGNGNGSSNNLASSSLFRILHGHAPLVIVINKVEYDAQNPSFQLQCPNAGEDNRNGPLPIVDSCTIQWAREDLNLKVGDKVLEINGQLIPGQEKVDVAKLLTSGPVEMVVARQSREETFVTQMQELSSKLERLGQERDGLKGENLRLKHRISYLEEVRHDEELAEEEDAQQQLTPKEKSSNRGASKTCQPQQPQQHDSLSSGESQSLYRSEIRVQAPVRQKPPRTSKLKASSNSTGRHSSSAAVPEADYVDHGKRLNSSSLDGRRGASAATAATEPNGDFHPLTNGGVTVETGSMNRIKTSSIVDRHFGHVIRVTHHHHPHQQQATPPPQTPSSASSSSHDYASRRQRIPADSVSVSDLQSVASYDSFIDSHPVRHNHIGQSMETVSNVSLMTRPFNQRSPSSPTRSEVQSVASMDLERRRHGYISDEQTISSSMNYGGLLTGGKKPKPVPPRKPSFLYLNRASSLQSVNGVVKTNSMDRSSNKIDVKSSKHSESESWNNNTAPKTSLRTALSGNLKWNILSSSRANKNPGSGREKEDRE